MTISKKSRMRGQFQEPNGLFYFPNFIEEAEEKKLLEFLEKQEYEQVVIHGQAAKRTVKHFGYHYDYQNVTLEKDSPFPKELKWLSDRCATKAEIPLKEIVQCLINQYPPKSTIGWHVDKFLFGSKILGISLLSSCKMRFQRKVEDKRFVYEIDLEPRSFYILSGEARFSWQHSIPAIPSKRYSITFRSLKKPTTYK
jgi:alkylated DNA repair protein (DNA oxidative demethylase)